MKLPLLRVLATLAASSAVAASGFDEIRLLGAQAVNLWKLDNAAVAAKPKFRFTVQDGENFAPQDEDDEDDAEADKKAGFEAQWFTQPLDHFDESVNKTWEQRYWVNTRHYKPGNATPVFVLDGGETSGMNRITFLDTGIMDILARNTGGIGIVLEHRYYGKSVPVPDFTTDNLRWLDNAQSAQDSANFMANVRFAGVDEDLTAPNTPWIYYGGSYAGARAAHMKILYPELVYGAIASSGVTHASILNWEYMDLIRTYADPVCSAHLQNAISTVDKLLGTKLRRPLKALFGLGNLTHDDDFASVLESPISAWQSKCWHPDFISTRFDDFCEALDKPPFGSGLQSLAEVPYGAPERSISLPDGLTVDLTILNYAGYVKKNVVARCPEEATLDECFGTYDAAQYQDTDLSQTWRLWLFQVCTEWGYFFTAPPDPTLPRIVSQLMTLEYQSKICRQAFPAGEHFKVPQMPNVTVVNALGDFGIAADRLAIIDGEIDPWRPQTPHSDDAYGREDTVMRPFKLIPGGVHHWDEWGLADIREEPYEVKKIHEEMIFFVKEWLKDWTAPEAM
ncbi:hypothetical protein HMN09_00980700 [Mycena chlorophos]|uniref:Peptidase S28 n=1 Tax=Mycena chlorophos TaxID=658473 RepID=A0A8H6W2X7_MYCCL|nr:hypothetical protein HMN09_00980700 [Mycena chlorophos]